MAAQEDRLSTPVYLKTRHDMPWPEEPVFYLLTGDGLFLCRNHRFFRSAVPAPKPPTELASQATSLVVRYPALPRRVLEDAVAFFAHLGDVHSAEGIVLLGWNEKLKKTELVVPEQVATVGRNYWGETWPIGVEYEVPQKLASQLTLFGDIHSHVDGAAYASFVDREDEQHLPGLHLVVGRVFSEPPEFFAQATVDGTRFNLSLPELVGNYQRRSPRFPKRWLERVKIKWPGLPAQPAADANP